MQHSRSWRVDAGLIAVAAVLGGFFFWDRLNTDPPQSAGVITDLAVGTLACAALLLRRRWPVAVAIALLPGILISSMSLGATAVAMSAVALYRSRAMTIAVVAGHTALLAFIFSAQGEVFWEGVIALLALDATMVTSGWLVRSERQRQVAAQREERAAARARAEEARHAERERIAREMHDILAHRLSLLAVYAGAFQVRRSAPQEEREAAAVIRQGAFEALQELRDVIWMLRDPATGDPTTSDPVTSDPAKRDPAADGPSASYPVARERDRPQPTLSDLPALIEQSSCPRSPSSRASTARGTSGVRCRSWSMSGQRKWWSPSSPRCFPILGTARPPAPARWPRNRGCSVPAPGCPPSRDRIRRVSPSPWYAPTAR